MVAGAFVLSLICPAAAGAGTFEADDKYPPGPTLVYKASPGERNRVTVRDVAGTTILTDPGSPVMLPPSDPAAAQRTLALCKPAPGPARRTWSAAIRGMRGVQPMRRIALTAFALFALVPVTSAHASEATIDNHGGALSLIYTADQGEKNDVAITHTGGQMKLVDKGAALIRPPVEGPTDLLQQTLAHCSFLLNTMTCDAEFSVGFYLGDGDDQVHAAGLVGGYGGPGADLMQGDHVNFDGGPGPDTMVAPPGKGTFEYGEDQPGDITVTLDGVANDGHAGEGDNVPHGIDVSIFGNSKATLIGDDYDNSLGVPWTDSGSSHIEGGAGDDYLSGGGGADVIDGGPGADWIYGNDGDNVIDGGPGSDYVIGGQGDETFHLRDGEVDNVECETGADTLFADAFDTDLYGCETVVTD